MKNKIYIPLLILLIGHNSIAYAWNWWPLEVCLPDNEHDTLYYAATIQATMSYNAAPSLLWHNSNGEQSKQPYSGNLQAGILKPATRPHRWWDYDGAVLLSGRVEGDNHHANGTGYFNQLYAHVRLYIVDITLGIRPVAYCTPGDKLSMGSLLLSNNTHPIPRVTIGIDRWTAIPGSFGYVEVKGGLTHAWLHDNNPYTSHTMLHHKYIGGRIGGKLPVNLSYEFHHAAQWGGYSNVYGNLGNSWTGFRNAFLVKSGGNTDNDKINAQGNHLGAQHLCLTLKGKQWYIDLSWQQLNEDGPIRFIGTGMNSADGLWGIHLRQELWPYIGSVSIEYLNTTDQSGPFHDRDGLIYGGNDSYYQNYIYRQGWTYFGRVIGNALLTPDNNRVQAFNIGVRGDILGYHYTLRAQHSRHYGTYAKPSRTQNTAICLSLKKRVERAWGLDFGLQLAADIGSTYGNNFATMITISKNGLITQW